MNPSDRDHDGSRRSFLASSGQFLSAAWIAAQWPAIAAAADHAAQVSAGGATTRFEYFSASEAADVEAIAAQIVPSGTTPGAREAHAVYFIDRALGTFFANLAPDFRPGLVEFQSRFRASNPAAGSFAAQGAERQIGYLKTVDRTEFFEKVRILTLLGMFSSPKYGGNYAGNGWKLMGFEDRHAFTPPFGYYDREYTGFVPYSAEKSA